MKYDPNPQWRRTYMLIIFITEAFLSMVVLALSVTSHILLEGYSYSQIYSDARIPGALITLISATVHSYMLSKERVVLRAIVIVNGFISAYWIATTILQFISIDGSNSITGVSTSSCTDLANVVWQPDFPKELLPHFRKACAGDKVLLAALPFAVAVTWLSFDITGRAIVAYFRLRNYRALGVKRVSWFSKTTSVSSIKEVVDNSPNTAGFDPGRPFFENGVWYNYRATPIGNNHSLSSGESKGI